jgi:hypothetical protein
MTLGALVQRLPARPLLAAALLAVLLGQSLRTLTMYRLPGWWFVLAVGAGLVLLALAVLRAAHRVATLTLPAPLRPVGAHADRFVSLLVVNLIILSALSPLFRPVAAVPVPDPVSRWVIASATALSGRVLFVMFSAGVVALGWIVLLGVLERSAGRWRPVRRLGLALDRLLAGFLILFCAGSLLAGVNGALDGSRLVHWRAVVAGVAGFELPFEFGHVAWVDLHGYPRPGEVEPVLLIGHRDQVWPQRAAPGQPVVVDTRAGLLGVPWVVAIRVDEDVLLMRALAAVPTAAAFRKAAIAALRGERRWAELRAHAEAHLRAYPNDRDYTLDLIRALEGAGQTADAAALRAAVRR